MWIEEKVAFGEQLAEGNAEDDAEDKIVIQLFFSSTIVWSQAHLNSKPHKTLWHAVHANNYGR